jgi:hypothetical protein
MKINRELLFQLYMERVDEITEVCDWKTSFGPEEIVDIIAGIIEDNGGVIMGNKIGPLKEGDSKNNQIKNTPTIPKSMVYDPPPAIRGIRFTDKYFPF